MKSTMRARWGLPAFGLLLGAAMFAASAAGVGYLVALLWFRRRG